MVFHNSMSCLVRLYQLNLFLAGIKRKSCQEKQNNSHCRRQDTQLCPLGKEPASGDRIVHQVRPKLIRHRIVRSPVDRNIIAVIVPDLILRQSILQGIFSLKLFVRIVGKYLGLLIHGKDKSPIAGLEQFQHVIRRKTDQKLVCIHRIIEHIQVPGRRLFLRVHRKNHLSSS